ncbi:MAG: hypothetical protein MZV63_41440 [Marinilabiliales bacterium]|nr:hypothetical protein [Marinilabiliales bacterium]
MMGNRVAELFGIDYPIIQAGMIWMFRVGAGVGGFQRRRTGPHRVGFDDAGDTADANCKM